MDQADPITVEVTANALQSVADEMGVALIRSAYSTNIKERRDCSCALFAADGDLIALAEQIPIHLGSMHGLIAQIARNRATWELQDGDAIIANDPYWGGGSHLPDVTLVQPVFYGGKLVAFAANIAHWSDVGGRSPGVGTAGDSTEIWQEGLRIPPTRIVSRGQIRGDLLDIIILNMRVRAERLGDLRAQMAALKLGTRRLQQIFERYGADTMSSCIAALLDHSERGLRSALRDIPSGSYSFSDVLDDDGSGSTDLPITLSVTIRHGSRPTIALDFSGTAPQARGGVNMVRSALLATVFYAVKAVIAPDVRSNAGFQRPIHVHAPEGSLVNATDPAPVGGRTDTCQRVVDTLLGALSECVPERVVAASTGATTAIVIGGTKALTGKDFVYVEALGGGLGARASKDGADGIQTHITNTSNLPVEAMEMEYPLRVMCHRLVADSGGPGKFRGGLSIRKDIQALAPVLFSAHSDRHRVAPWGLFGGQPGRRARFLLSQLASDTRQIPSKISGVTIGEGDILSIQTAGGGGFGDPLERDPSDVTRDCARGKVTHEQASTAYGVVIDKSGTVNEPATVALRAEIRSQREI